MPANAAFGQRDSFSLKVTRNPGASLVVAHKGGEGDVVAQAGQADCDVGRAASDVLLCGAVSVLDEVDQGLANHERVHVGILWLRGGSLGRP